MRRLKIWFRILYQFFLSMNCVRKANLLSAEQTRDIVIKEKKSLIRLGDGELNILEGKGIHYQEANNTLQKEMGELIQYYIDKGGNCEYLLCMPNEFLKCYGTKLLKKRVWVSSWARFRYVFKKNYDRKIKYGEAFLFATKYEDVYKQIWEEKEYIIFVHNNEKYAQAFKKKYGKEVVFIKVPGQNSYQCVEEIVASIARAIGEICTHKENGIVLLSAGPCAKTIVFRLKDIGVQIVDTGHCWDEPLALM